MAPGVPQHPDREWFALVPLQSVTFTSSKVLLLTFLPAQLSTKKHESIQLCQAQIPSLDLSMSKCDVSSQRHGSGCADFLSECWCFTLSPQNGTFFNKMTLLHHMLEGVEFSVLSLILFLSLSWCDVATWKLLGTDRSGLRTCGKAENKWRPWREDYEDVIWRMACDYFSPLHTLLDNVPVLPGNYFK